MRLLGVTPNTFTPSSLESYNSAGYIELLIMNESMHLWKRLLVHPVHPVHPVQALNQSQEKLTPSQTRGHITRSAYQASVSREAADH